MKSLFYGQNSLSQMVREVIGSTQQDAEAIASWISFVVLFRHGHVALQPLLWQETGEFFQQAAIHVRPVFRQFRNRRQWFDCPIMLGDEYRIKLWMHSFTKPENRMQPIVDRCKVTEKIKNSVPARCYLQQELLFCQCREELVGASNGVLPGSDNDGDCQLLGCHRNAPAFRGNEDG